MIVNNIQVFLDNEAEVVETRDNYYSMILVILEEGKTRLIRFSTSFLPKNCLTRIIRDGLININNSN